MVEAGAQLEDVKLIVKVGWNFVRSNSALIGRKLNRDATSPMDLRLLKHPLLRQHLQLLQHMPAMLSLIG